MPRKTKDQNKVKNEKKQKSSNLENVKKESIMDKIKQTLNITSEEEKKSAKETSNKTSTKKNVAKSDDKKVTLTTKKTDKNSSKKSSIEAGLKKMSTKKTETKTSSKTGNDKAKKTATKKTASKTTKKAKTVSNVSKAKTKKAPIRQKETPQIVEYYDLPYRYNQTLVKLLYQTPTTLFVYWDISDKDRENYKHIYGENFFEITKPVLIIHNITLNYSHEIDINDFANSWYIHVNDSNCEYIIELGRRPIYYNAEIKENYIYISKSNDMVIPNDKILFNVDILDSLYFRNVKNGEDKYYKLSDLLKKVNKNEFPLINYNSLNELYKAIYGNENIEEIYNLNNPSSGNPSSESLSSRFL